MAFGWEISLDQYLASFKTPTVNIKSEELKKHCINFPSYYRWKELFLKRNIKAIVVSHGCYFMGLPARIEFHLEYLISNKFTNYIFFYGKKIFFHLVFFIHIKMILKNGSSNSRKFSRERLKLIFEGSTEVDQPYIKKSAYNQKKKFFKNSWQQTSY